jgi:hypothetical protein
LKVGFFMEVLANQERRLAPTEQSRGRYAALMLD